MVGLTGLNFACAKFCATSKRSALRDAASVDWRQGNYAPASDQALACRVAARCVGVARLKMSAFAKATARQSSLSSTTRAKTGGKGITLPLVHPIMFPFFWTLPPRLTGFGGKGIIQSYALAPASELRI